jgi:tryptophan synthase alpha chain
MNRIEKKFRQLKKEKKKAFIAFISAGFPSLEATKNLMLEFEHKGVDIVELGVPFSDPLADGPVIQEASLYALAKGVTLAKIIAMVKQVRKDISMPVCLMSYYNPILAFGLKQFARKAKEAGVDGVIVPDLPPEESLELSRLCAKAKIDLISFLAPTSTLQRIKYIGRRARGFIYYVSLTGVTGTREKLSADIQNNLRLIKKHAFKPVCAGFGISKHAHVAQVGRVADGVIVGSAIVRKIKQYKGCSSMVQRVGAYVESLRK